MTLLGTIAQQRRRRIPIRPSGDVDPYYNYITALFDFSVLADGTIFEDFGPHKHPVTAVSQATLSSGKLILPGGGNDYIYIPDSGRVQITDDFCFDFWNLDITAGGRLCGQYNASGSNRGWMMGASNGTINLTVWASSASDSAVGTGNIDTLAGTIPHLRLSRNAGVFRVHVNGVLVGKVENFITNSSNISAPFCLGSTNDSYGASAGVTGSMSAFRFTQHSRDTTDANFTPEALPLPKEAPPIEPTPSSSKWRVAVTSTVASNYGTRIAEFRFIDDADNDISRIGASASGSAYYSSFSHANTIDGSSSTYFRSNYAASTSSPIIVNVDFPEAITPHKIGLTVQNATDGAPRDFSIQQEVNGAWITRFSASGITDWALGVEKIFTLEPVE